MFEFVEVLIEFEAKLNAFTLKNSKKDFSLAIQTRNFMERYRNGIRSKDEILEHPELLQLIVSQDFHADVKRIYSLYIIPGSVQEVNVPGLMGVKIKEKIEDGVVSIVVFDEVIEEVLNMVCF